LIFVHCDPPSRRVAVVSGYDRPVRRGLLAGATLVALIALSGAPALAQSTGGSMGGGSWGGGGSSYSGGGSSYSGGGSSGGYYSSSGDSSGESAPAGVLVLFLFLIGISLVFKAHEALSKAHRRAVAAQRAAGKIDVSALQLAIDWRARAWVQSELEVIARSADTSSPAGLLAMLERVAHLLRRSKDSWLYAGVVDSVPLPQDRAQALFQQTAADARAKFRDELLRYVDGGASEQELLDELVPRSHEGEGLVVVTLVIAARGSISDFGNMRSVESVRSWLEVLDYLPARDLVACEVIWSPAEPDDRMSSVELEARYPTLRKLRPGVVTGRIQCRYCSGFSPGELRTCPHCGARSSTADAA
jgi:uncharacterized membrane protein